MEVSFDVALCKFNHGDPRSEYRLEWTEEERLDSAFLVLTALHLEALHRVSVNWLRSEIGSQAATKASSSSNACLASPISVRHHPQAGGLMSGAASKAVTCLV